MDIVQTLGLLSGAGWASGVNLYATAAVLGISGRMGWISLPGQLDMLSEPLIIGLAVTLFVVEAVADKVPYVDSTWDAVHTFIRPTGGAALGFLAAGDAGPLVQTAGALLTGSLALDSHLTKSVTRAAINTSPEPVSNIVASVTEDGLVIGMMWFMVQHPVWTMVIVVAFVVFSVWFLNKMWHFVKKLFRRRSPDVESASA